jgi:hypothetical protein
MRTEKGSSGFFYNNGLTIVFLLMFVFALAAQFYAGYTEHEDFLKEHHSPGITMLGYLTSGHFLQATFENWESEFLQMGLFVFLTIFLRQKGSSESKKCDEPAIDPSELIPKEGSPWSVTKGGVFLWFYKNSLTVVLLMIFLACFFGHWYGSWKNHCEEEAFHNRICGSFSDYFFQSQFWFESFQNWQSEFLSVFAIIFFSIYLRQIGSSQSKPVNAPHSETGE